MSTETMTPKPVKTKKTKEEKSAKKRSLEQADTTTSTSAEQSSSGSSSGSSSSDNAATNSSQPDAQTKRPRIHSPETSSATPKSPFIQQTSSFYLPLSPIYHAFPLDGLCAEHISPLLLTYYPPLRGVLLSYSNPRLSSDPSTAPSSRDAQDASPTVLAKSIDEYAVSFIWLTVDVVLLRPEAGSVIEGYVSVQNESYLGLVCWNFFNAGVDRKRIPQSWKWVADSSSSSSATRTSSDWMKGVRSKSDESQGHYVDAEGKKVEGLVKFTVKDFESAPSSERERGFLSIEGTLLEKSEDKKVDDEVRAARRPKNKKKSPPALHFV